MPAILFLASGRTYHQILCAYRDLGGEGGPTYGTLVQARGVLPRWICASDPQEILEASIHLLAHAVGVTDPPDLAAGTVPRRRVVTAESSVRVMGAIDNVACCRRLCGQDERSGEEHGREEDEGAKASGRHCYREQASSPTLYFSSRIYVLHILRSLKPEQKRKKKKQRLQ